MSYEKALEAAGATVEAFRQFGSYQGDWWALVTLLDGQRGWVSGSYGSCSVCDAFEGEFGFTDGECDVHRYGQDAESRDTCPVCADMAAEYGRRLAVFGAGYLDVMSQEQAEKQASSNLEWDMEAAEMVAWIKSYAAEPGTARAQKGSEA